MSEKPREKLPLSQLKGCILTASLLVETAFKTHDDGALIDALRLLAGPVRQWKDGHYIEDGDEA